MSTRTAEVYIHGNVTPEVVAAYLPANYKIVEVVTGTLKETEEYSGTAGKPCKVIISGIDNHGWTLDGYVIPRLGSGMIAAKEIPNLSTEEK